MTDNGTDFEPHCDFRQLRSRKVELKTVDSATIQRSKGKPRARSVPSHSRSPIGSVTRSDGSSSDLGLIVDVRDFITEFRPGLPVELTQLRPAAAASLQTPQVSDTVLVHSTPNADVKSLQLSPVRRSHNSIADSVHHHYLKHGGSFRNGKL